MIAVLYNNLGKEKCLPYPYRVPRHMPYAHTPNLHSAYANKTVCLKVTSTEVTAAIEAGTILCFQRLALLTRILVESSNKAKRRARKGEGERREEGRYIYIYLLTKSFLVGILLPVLDGVGDQRSTQQAGADAQRSTAHHAHAATPRPPARGAVTPVRRRIPAVASVRGGIIPAVAGLWGVAAVGGRRRNTTNTTTIGGVSRLWRRSMGYERTGAAAAVVAGLVVLSAMVAAAHQLLAALEQLAQQPARLWLVGRPWRQLVREGPWRTARRRRLRSCVLFGLELTR